MAVFRITCSVLAAIEKKENTLQLQVYLYIFGIFISAVHGIFLERFTYIPDYDTIYYTLYCTFEIFTHSYYQLQHRCQQRKIDVRIRYNLMFVDFHVQLNAKNSAFRYHQTVAYTIIGTHCRAAMLLNTSTVFSSSFFSFFGSHT